MMLRMAVIAEGQEAGRRLLSQLDDGLTVIQGVTRIHILQLNCTRRDTLSDDLRA